MAVALSIGVLPGSRGGAVDHARRGGRPGQADDERDGDLTPVRRGAAQTKKPGPPARLPRLPSVSPISSTSSTCPKRGGCPGLRSSSTIKSRPWLKGHNSGVGSRVKKAQKVADVIMLPRHSALNPRLMGFPSPSRFPPKRNPENAPPPPSGAFFFLGAYPFFPDSSIKRLFGEAIESPWRSTPRWPKPCLQRARKRRRKYNRASPIRRKPAQVPALSLQIPFYR